MSDAYVRRVWAEAAANAASMAAGTSLRSIEEEEHERRARIRAARHPDSRDAIRASNGDWAHEVDPGFHPLLSRSAIARELDFWCRGCYDRESASDALETCFVAMREAMRLRSIGCALCSPGALDLWLGRAHGPAPDPAAGGMFLRDQYAAIMLLAVGAPISIVPGSYRGNRGLIVRPDYADRHLHSGDVRELPHYQWNGRFMSQALAAAFATLRHLAGADPDLMGPLRNFMVAIANSGRAAVNAEDDLILAADLAPLYIACDWIEEEMSAGIARNIRQVADWMGETSETWLASGLRKRRSAST